ncbi:MAG TPA: ATP-binding cassette domain-containing protein [Solirubrobacteraceae bacterium]|nr:ATP-binding cassette domain-containing protein [Solirubrobacteraceae bacterium]
MYAIEATGLRKTYPGGVEAVKGIDFEVSEGEVFGLLGPNGAGKSTTVGMLTTTIVPTAGTARLVGHDVARSALLARSVSSVVFQEAVVDRSLSGRANLELHTRLWGVPADRAKRRIDELVDKLGLSELIERPVGSYSGGERRRLEIARALCSEPQVLFLDEPTVGLDPRIRHELLDVIAGLRARDELTILVTTHYLDEAQRLCDRVAIIHEGALVALDSPKALLAKLGSSSSASTGAPTACSRPCGTEESLPKTRSLSERGSRSRSTTTRSRRHSPRSSPSACARRRSRRACRTSTTFTCN